ncbi:PTS glucitol/sorbitol transporter subunit IIA [Lacticaseibacillus absianus]|uniref:PTS glucitol/sorbitol transporter subunit IIA n=1 Tax=Lacticaseibacillus absianus TaxID=2729623 RepID=UPI0015CCA4CC|nr:PTS glucitol/sorbitol transporter subunit IIA [Lacticaseibacillus absianus]
MDITATIKAIGESALSPTDPLVILFDDSATPALRAVTLIQQFDDPQAQRDLEMQAGDTLTIDGEDFAVTAVGKLANANLRSIGHVALVFAPQPAVDRLESALYLKPTSRPHFTVGTTLVYHTR